MLFLPVALASSLGEEGVHSCAGTITVTSVGRRTVGCPCTVRATRRCHPLTKLKSPRGGSIVGQAQARQAKAEAAACAHELVDALNEAVAAGGRN